MNAAMAMAARHRHKERVRARAARSVLLASALLLGAAPAVRAQLQPAATVPGEVLVQFEPGTSPSARADVRVAAGTHVQDALRRPGLQLLRVEPGTSVPAAIRRLERSARVRFAQPNIVYRAAAAPDPQLPAQWDMTRIGVPAAWAVTRGSPSVTVAVVDSGIADGHPDLQANVDVSRGRDFFDDGIADGSTDPFAGFDPLGDPRDLNGHGTHVAGTIAAVEDNGLGGAGVAPLSRLVSVRVLDGHGAGASDDLANGLDYAGDIGARVANVSISGTGSDPAVAATIRAHPDTLYVVAAGNGPSNNDATPQTPCNVDALNVICVAATDQGDRLAGFSNYGRTSVDLGAPGTEILSTEPARSDMGAPAGAPSSWGQFDAILSGWDTSSGWASTTARAVSGYSATDSPLGAYALNSNLRMTTLGSFDLSGRRGCATDYSLWLDTKPGDLVRVMTDNHGGGTFFDQDTWVGTSGGVFTRLRTFLDSDGKPVRLRFGILANGDANVGDGAYVDNVSVSCFTGPGAGAYVQEDGTSMATPHVAGVAALIWAARPAASVASVRCDLLGSGPVLGDLTATTVSGRRVDAAAAVAGGRSAVPPAGTGGADGLAPTGATLHGFADPCSTDSAYQFEIGPTTAYGTTTAATSIGAGDAPVPAGAAVGGLAPSTTYHYRLVTIRDGVRLPGADQTFTTPAPSVTPRALTLRDVTATCKRTGKGRKRTVACTLRRATAVNRLRARLTKRGRLYARASGRPPRSGRVKLKLVRRLHAGRYRVTLTLRDRKGASRTIRRTVKA